MSRPGVGNPGNKGGKAGASGRKSAYDEFKEAAWHADVWNKDQEVQKLIEKIRSGKYSVRDVVLFRALVDGVKGKSEGILGKFMDKLLADLHEISGKDGSPISIALGDTSEYQAIRDEYEEKLRQAYLEE